MSPRTILQEGGRDGIPVLQDRPAVGRRQVEAHVLALFAAILLVRFPGQATPLRQAVRIVSTPRLTGELGQARLALSPRIDQRHDHSVEPEFEQRLHTTIPMRPRPIMRSSIPPPHLVMTMASKSINRTH